MTLKILTDMNGKNIKDIRPLYGISESGNQNLSEYLENKLSLQNKNTILVEPKKSENGSTTIKSNGISDTQHLGTESSERSSGKPIPNSQSEQNGNNQEDKLWAATMLEMDLQAQGGAIWETQQEKDPLLEHNRNMMKKMKEENIPWAESYPGELYPTEQDQN